jgi:hypothetical protein
VSFRLERSGNDYSGYAHCPCCAVRFEIRARVVVETSAELNAVRERQGLPPNRYFIGTTSIPHGTAIQQAKRLAAGLTEKPERMPQFPFNDPIPKAR